MQCYNKRMHHHDSSVTTYDVSQGYVDLMVRQFYVNQCLLLIWIAPFVGAIGGLLSYWTNHIKITRRFVKPTERTRSRFIRVLGAALMLQLMAMAFAYPNGAWWILDEIKHSCY
jgi:hypothetical protein